MSSCGFGDAYAGATESDYLSTYTPATPPDDRLFGLSNVLPLASYSTELPTLKMEGSLGDEDGQNMHDLGLHALEGECIGDLLRLHHESP